MHPVFFILWIATYRGKTIGDSSLWGVEEFYTGEYSKNEHHDEIVNDLTQDAIAEALEFLDHILADLTVEFRGG